MTLNQWILICEKAIQSNFNTRNVRVFSYDPRHLRILHTRRNNVRRWIINLRLAKNPSTAKMVADSILWHVN